MNSHEQEKRLFCTRIAAISALVLQQLLHSYRSNSCTRITAIPALVLQQFRHSHVSIFYLLSLQLFQR